MNKKNLKTAERRRTVFDECLELYASFYSIDEKRLDEAEEKFNNIKFYGNKQDYSRAMQFLKESHKSVRKKEKIRGWILIKLPIFLMMIIAPVCIIYFVAKSRLAGAPVLAFVVLLQRIFAKEKAKEVSFEVQVKKITGVFDVKLKKASVKVKSRK